MKTIAIYYLILIMIGSQIPIQYVHVIKQEKRVSKTSDLEHKLLREDRHDLDNGQFVDEKEDLWAINAPLLEEGRKTERGQADKQGDFKEKIEDYSIKVEEEKAETKQVERQDRENPESDEKEKSKIQIEEKESAIEEERKENEVSEEEKEKEKRDWRAEEKNDSGMISKQEDEEKEETKQQEIKQEEKIKDNACNEKQENQAEQQNEYKRQEQTKEENNDQNNKEADEKWHNQQSTASSYEIERKESKNETNVEELDYSKEESQDIIRGKLQKDQVIEGDLYIEKEGIDLNGKTLEVKGNLYHNKGKLIIHNGRLLVHENYFVNNEIKQSGNESVLVLKNDDDLVIVNGDIVSYGSDWIDKCTKGKIILEGNFIGRPKASEMSYKMPTGSEWELILAGEDNQIVNISSMCVKLPNIIIKGRKNRQIKLMMLKNNTNQLKEHHLNRIENEVACQIDLPESMAIEIINTKAPMIINGVCKVTQLNVLGNRVIINGNLKVRDGIDFSKGQVHINGSLILLGARNIKMNNSEDQMKIRDDFELHNCKETILNRGELCIGGNIVQSNMLEQLITGNHLTVVFLNHQEDKKRVQGNLIALSNVKYSKSSWDEAL